MIGRTLGGYRVIEQIGIGGMATVYKAYDPGTDRYVALKILPEHYSTDPTFRERFQREAKAIARLEHPRILPIFAYGEEDGTAYLVMRYMETGTLADAMREREIGLQESGEIITQIADALDYAHTHGVIHRDVKPSNVLLDKNGNAYLTDFGIAKMVEGTSELTGSGLLGTPFYMSPEQCAGRKDLTPASDQYSLGIILYEMVTGQKPFQGETPVAVVMKHLHDPLPSPRTYRPDLPESVERPIYKALAKEPDQRFESCRALASAFTKAVNDYTMTVPLKDEAATLPIGRVRAGEAPTVAAPPATRRSIPIWAVLGGLAAIVVLVGAAILGGLFNPRTGQPPPTTPAEQVGAAAPTLEQAAGLPTSEATQPPTSIPAQQPAAASATPEPAINSVVLRVSPICPKPVITTQDNVVARVGWASGTPEEAENGAKHLSFVVTLDGSTLNLPAPIQSPLQTSTDNPYNTCGGEAKPTNVIFFDFQVGQLQAGQHTISVEYILDASVMDAGTPIGPGSAGNINTTFDVSP